MGGGEEEGQRQTETETKTKSETETKRERETERDREGERGKVICLFYHLLSYDKNHINHNQLVEKIVLILFLELFELCRSFFRNYW